ncbi:UDP-N-acetylmuramoyl-L-alanyl-D-glutamate--2,6-diaminopimelate ligase [Nitrolancea hollandica]|uniref:UDP-N-acetylmuramyl-tripeptide synthetase n=1 Tax=Nitrolancea hollandica Lb TaxID=1129897 RepID=I4EDS2_9BACT|nr:UDP-N-acetylmuramoyl-L-alanyl-D-glutamate--2,6-diaminopimelate ligase [Nitrolancea hollandica]CCF82834.1 UDP-N-acetylmuramyl-tripeptide synthetase [Nitrolancea hollandica Lb]
MIAISLADLLTGIPTTRLAGDSTVLISNLCYDSRLAGPGSLFVALRGSYTDGHRYLRDARARGAHAALVESWEPEVAGFPAVVQVPSTRVALAPLAARFFGYPGESLNIIGVTGTDGKTTTAYLIDVMLRASGFRTGMLGTVAIRVGERVIEHDNRQTTPESLEVQRLLADMREAAVDWAVLEATSHGLALPRLDCCPFDIGVVTNITQEHLEFHGTVEEYRWAKARLLERVSAGSGRPGPRGAVLNADDEGARSIAPAAGPAPIVWFSSRGARAEIRATGIETGSDGTRFRLETPTGSAGVRLALIGQFNVDNALAAAGVGHLIGLSAGEIAEGIGSLESVPGRLRRVALGQPFEVIVDYAHTPESLEKTLRLVRGLVRGRVIAVFGSAGERDRVKRPLQGAVGARLADISIFTSEDPRCEDPEAIIAEISAGAEAAGAVEGRDYFRIEDRRAAIRAAIERAGPGDAVVLAGKGHEQCIIYGVERRPWDEAGEAMAALQGIGYGQTVEGEGGGR